ncbi:MAG TPA: hypothetical protein VF543_22040 [Pyrinomonadaceae bacterium]|jgi:hypothetical protein
MKEVPLQKDILIPLFRAMGFRDVKHYHGGPNELGKDIVMWREEELRERINYGVVVKADKITGQASSTKNSANEVLFQILQAFNETYPDLSTGEEQWIQRCFVVSSKEISKEAINAIKGTLRKDNLDKVTTFIDGDTLWDLIQKHLPEKGVLEEIQSAKTKLEALLKEHKLSEHFQIVADTEGVFELRVKRSDALEEHPLPSVLQIKINPDDPESSKAFDELKRMFATGAPLKLKNPYIAKFQMPNFMEQLFGFTPESMEVTIGPQSSLIKHPVKLIIEDKDGQRAQVDYLLLEDVQSGTEQMTFSNEKQESPWKFKVVVDLINHQSNFNLNFEPIGLNVYQVLEGFRFNQAMSRGGWFVVESRTNGFQLAEQQIEPGKHPEPDPKWFELLEAMLFIQQKTFSLLKCPEKVGNDDAQLVFILADILRTGHAQVESSPWEIKLNFDQAKQVLTDFGDSAPREAVVHYNPNHVVKVFDTDVPLGPVLYQCNKAYMTEENVQILRTAVEADKPGDNFTACITPFEDHPFNASYMEWLPIKEKAVILRTPLFRGGMLQNAARILLEATKREGEISIDDFVRGLAEACAHIPSEEESDYSILNPFANSTSEEIRIALRPIVEDLDANAKFDLSVKLCESKLLSSDEAAQLIGMNHKDFIAAIDKNKKAGSIPDKGKDLSSSNAA